jgi:UDP-N-acetylmuramyl pentapeptide phosphotransferase/UDP-N-acetylglucosamine-1-phosphate transferase
VTILAGGMLLVLAYPGQASAIGACLCGLVAVAAVGWLDDHRPLSAWPRLLVHLMAALVAALVLLGVPATATQLLLVAFAMAWIVGLTNAWNFMDGINGLATIQAVLAMACIFCGGLLYAWIDPAWSAFALIIAGATLGFLPFNFPHARIFLGDVGSCSLGFVLACVLLRAIVSGGMPWWLALLPVSAFLVDAGLTLGKRVLQGRAWWRPHREHLYQWMVREGTSHATVAMIYGSWTLAISLAALVFGGLDASQSAGISAAALLSAAVLWGWARKRLWINARTSNARIGSR